MAATHTTAQVNINPRFAQPLTSISWKHHKTAPRCALSPQNESRRIISISLVLLHSLSTLPPHAIAGSMFDRYVKSGQITNAIGYTVNCNVPCNEEILVNYGDHSYVYMSTRKKLEPLETYVPAVILTQLQIKDIEESLMNAIESQKVDQSQFAVYRSILRSGPAASFRSNIRAVAEYASDGGKGKTAFDDVDQCLRALDELDSLLLRASRNNPDATPKLMKEKISTAVNALNSLLQTVPSDILETAKAIADAYRTPESSEAPQELDQELKELQSIL